MTLGFAEVAWTKSQVKITDSSKSQTGSHCISSEFYNFETGDPYKEKRTVAQKQGLRWKMKTLQT